MVTAVIDPREGIVKRLAGIAAVALTLTALVAGPAAAQEGAPGFDIKENPALVATGSGSS
jgi:hypothetical protein